MIRKAITIFFDEDSGKLAKVESSEAFEQLSYRMQMYLWQDVTEYADDSYHSSENAYAKRQASLKRVEKG